MPHLVIDRLRDTTWLPECTGCCARTKWGKNIACLYTLEVLEIIAGTFFLWGSIDFLPQYSAERIYLLRACECFSVGGGIYFAISLFSLSEAVDYKGGLSLEVCKNGLYLLGAFLFEAGTLLYWPFQYYEERGYKAELRKAQAIGVGVPVYLNYRGRYFTGTLLFIVGSLFFACAAFVNGLSQRSFNDWRDQLMITTTSSYMLGSIMFVMGSVAYLPDLGCNQNMEMFGGFCFIAGSVMYKLGGWVSLYRTLREVQWGDDETTPLRRPSLKEVQ